jgi:dethiobiotin synthetase
VLVVVAGIGTGVGKTWVTAGVAGRLRSAGVRVAARKPVQSFGEDERGRTDAELLAAATGERPEDVCPAHRWYEVPMAPPMAAEVLGRPAFTTDDLVAEVSTGWPPAAVDVGFVETAGGPRSPMAADGDGVDLARALAPDLVVVVADAGLGTINAVRLSADALAPLPVVVFANRYDDRDDLHRRNVAWLRDRDGLDVVTHLHDADDADGADGPHGREDSDGLVARLAGLVDRAGSA